MVQVLYQWALEKGEHDIPDERKVHSRATPRLGDTGSLVVGFMPGVPIIDTLWVMLRRIRRKLSPLAPDRTLATCGMLTTMVTIALRGLS